MDPYQDFIAKKAHAVTFDGIETDDLAPHLFPHQRDLVRWALRRGRAAIFADTGLGKGLMLLEWARHVAMRGRVLILAPLAVGHQLAREAARFGVEASYARRDDGSRILITNYELLEHFDPAQFAGVVLDESSILKAHDGATRTAIIEAFAAVPYRLACTATPAPNDHTELGNHSQFLGIKTRTEMLAEYFIHDGATTQEWRLKGHATKPFWRWVCSWGAIVRKPSDLGYPDDGFALPPLRMHEVVIPAKHDEAWRSGTLFAGPAMALNDQRRIRRETLAERVAAAAKLAAGDEPVLVWCELNEEGDALERAIPDGVQVKGAHSSDDKEDRLLGFVDGRHRVMISKASIFGFGLNLQHCRRMVFLGASHSYEQTYQAIRRCWRFGQTKPVDVHIIRSELDDAIMANYRRKEADAARMGAEMAEHAAESLRAIRGATAREWNEYAPRKLMRVPRWAA
jgi:superfamily II DNA or RNA helicase